MPEEKKNQKTQYLPVVRPSIFNLILILSLSIFILLNTFFLPLDLVKFQINYKPMYNLLYHVVN